MLSQKWAAPQADVDRAPSLHSNREVTEAHVTVQGVSNDFHSGTDAIEIEHLSLTATHH